MLITKTVTVLEKTINVDVLYYQREVPAKIDGPPENCYPAESCEIEFSISEYEEDYIFLQTLLENCEYFGNELEKELVSAMDQPDEEP